MLRPPRRLLFQRTARNLCENVEGGVTQHKLCPWWVGYLITSPFRKLWQNPALILEPHIRAGMTVLEPGPGMGFFTLEIAKLVGSSGRVVAVDVEPQMIEGLKRRNRPLRCRSFAKIIDAASVWRLRKLRGQWVC